MPVDRADFRRRCESGDGLSPAAGLSLLAELEAAETELRRLEPMRRLGHPASDCYWRPKAKQAEADLARLRTALAARERGERESDEECDKLDAENDRLRAMYGEAVRLHEEDATENRRLEAENERLRAEFATTQAERDRWMASH